MAFSLEHNPFSPHSEHGIGEIWRTETILSTGDAFHIIFVAETKSKSVSLKSLGIEGILIDMKHRLTLFLTQNVIYFQTLQMENIVFQK